MADPERRAAVPGRRGVLALLALALLMPGAAAAAAPACGGDAPAASAAGVATGGVGADLHMLFGIPARLARAPTSRAVTSPDGAPHSAATARSPVKRKRTSRLERPAWRRLAIASAVLVAGGGLAARWSKAKADRAYDRYLHSAGPQRRERALDRAERYDRLAGSGFLAMEAGLAACAYIVFF